MDYPLLPHVFLAGNPVGVEVAEEEERLAAAADIVRSGSGGRGDIPNFPERTDEIGDLADSFRSMTGNLYDRIDAIESFAADVAHELKNPLTSLRSALETASRPNLEPERRDKLMAIVDADSGKVVSTLDLKDTLIGTPSIAGGAVYVRSDKALVKLGGS